MRIIAGKHRGRRLSAPATDAVRPTTDRVRESLFELVGDFDEAVVVDGYAGSGVLGCEALSRGAAHVFFFDASRRSLDVAKHNVELIGDEDRSTFTKGAFAKTIGAVDRAVDIVFLDPPYGSREPELALAALAESEHIRKDCLIVLEQDIRDDVPDHPEFEFDESRTYGNTRLTFFYRR